MGDWYVGEIRLFSMAWNPKYWLLCDGSLLQIKSNQALFSLLGTMYGGNGTTTFALPDFRGRTPVGVSLNDADYQCGKTGGTETVVLDKTQIPPHQHNFLATTSLGNTTTINANTYISTAASTVSVPTPPKYFATATAPQMTMLNPNTVAQSGGSTGHPNVQPSLALNFCIAYVGVFPPRN